MRATSTRVPRTGPWPRRDHPPLTCSTHSYEHAGLPSREVRFFSSRVVFFVKMENGIVGIVVPSRPELVQCRDCRPLEVFGSGVVTVESVEVEPRLSEMSTQWTMVFQAHPARPAKRALRSRG